MYFGVFVISNPFSLCFRVKKFLEGRNFKEVTFWMDIKIVLIAIACVLGYVSHFVMKFPSQANEVGLCLVGYGVLMAIHYFIEYYKEKGSFFMSKSHEVSQCQSNSIANASICIFCR